MSDTDIFKVVAHSLRRATDVGYCRCGNRFQVRYVRFVVLLYVVVLTEDDVKISGFL